MCFGARGEEDHAKHSAWMHRLLQSGVCLSAGGKQEASHDRDGKELKSQRSGQLEKYIFRPLRTVAIVELCGICHSMKEFLPCLFQA